MYNMDISILGYKLNLEILILIGIVYLIMVGHTVCGCCNMGKIMEGATTLAASMNKNNKKSDNKTDAKLPTQVSAGDKVTMTAPLPTDTKKEGFTGANTNYGESSLYNLSGSSAINTSAWSMPDLTVIAGQPLSAGVKNFLAREPQPVPLPEGELLMFANTPFKPECCPNTYSNSMGCACMTGEQYNYLQTRSGNNVPYSEY
jgi:hypothetical protein